MRFLTDKTQLVFNSLAEHEIISEFTFVGGSAISYYLQHRLSEDLDFFTWQKLLPDNISLLIKDLSKDHKAEVVNSTSEYLDVFIDDIKVTFFANDWDVLKTNRNSIAKNIFAGDLKLLCAMKVNTLSLRAKFRDYYDLYVINKEKISIKDRYNNAAFYLPGFTKKIFVMQLTYIQDITDENIEHLAPKYKVSIKDIQKHFEKELHRFL
jgi:predicted nucleotidyltransferase component of viral defense system